MILKKTEWHKLAKGALFVLFSIFGHSSLIGQHLPPTAPDSVHAPIPAVDSVSYLVNTINLVGNKKTKHYIVFREVVLKEGVSYTTRELADAIRLTKEQLMNTALFVDAKVDTLQLGNNTVDISIEVKERWYLFPFPYFKVVDRNWNVWLKEHGGNLNRTNYGVKIAHDNLTGRNDKFNLWLINGYTQQFSFNYFQPYADKKLRFGYNVGFMYARNREVNYQTSFNKQEFLKMPNFARTQVRADAGFSYRKGSDLRMQAKVSYHFDEYDTAIINRNPNLLGNGQKKAKYTDISYRIQYYKVDYIPYPLRGWYFDLYAMSRLGGQGSLNMMELGGKYLSTWEVMKKGWITFQAAAILRIPQRLPYFNSRLLGYDDVSMQGLEYYVADGTLGGITRLTLKKQVFQFTIKHLFKSRSHSERPFRFFLKAYGNLGYVYNKNPGNSIMNNKLLRTAGIGLDIVTIYDWALKFDFSFNQFDSGGRLYLHTQSDF